jgi:hypothetical protein
MKAMMCFLVEFWDVGRQPEPPIKPHSEPYIDFEWPVQGWCIDLPQVLIIIILLIIMILPFAQCGRRMIIAFLSPPIQLQITSKAHWHHLTSYSLRHSLVPKGHPGACDSSAAHLCDRPCFNLLE